VPVDTEGVEEDGDRPRCPVDIHVPLGTGDPVTIG
jgi:hypothetical protein